MANYEQVSYSTRIRYPLLGADSNPITHAESLLKHYSFDLGSRSVQDLLADWQAHYSPQWIRLAVVEALYQGRYKAISVDEILKIWRRRRQPTPHFSREFERLVGDRFPRKLLSVEQRKGLPRRLQPDDSAWMNLARQALDRNGEQLKPRSHQLALSVQQLSDELSAGLSADLPDTLSDELSNKLSDAKLSDDRLSETQCSKGEAVLLTQAVDGTQAVDETVTQPTALTSLTDGVVLPDLNAELDIAIHQFVPTDVSPEFCNKLKAVANSAVEHISPSERLSDRSDHDCLEAALGAAIPSETVVPLAQSSGHLMNQSTHHHVSSDAVMNDLAKDDSVIHNFDKVDSELLDRSISSATADSF
ncbi:hypothetical protein ACN4EG_03380 [Alkalinema pantanalense CENA528]|uniref:hypothetical protein n=1 Tax=Alkalinema pantanalense TaxID=1620705 RepID=UPI003D6E2567